MDGALNRRLLLLLLPDTLASLNPPRGLQHVFSRSLSQRTLKLKTQLELSWESSRE